VAEARRAVVATRLALGATLAAGAVFVPTAAYSQVPGGLGDDIGRWAIDHLAERAAAGVLSAVAYFASGVLSFLGESSKPAVTAAWFAGPSGPFVAVRSVAAVALVGFALAGVVAGVIAGDVAAMVRRVVLGVPVAVVGMVAATEVTARVMAVIDAWSAVILDPATAPAARFLREVGAPATVGSAGLAAVVVGIVAAAAALALWIELLIRSALIYVLVALLPLAFAAIVWPPGRAIARRLIEMLVAVIVSKLVIAIAIALAVGVAALTGPLAGNDGGESLAATTGGLVVATAVLSLAAFSPFLLLRLVPLAETAAAAHGISRAPLRSATAAVTHASTTATVLRLAGSSAGHTRSLALAAGTPPPPGPPQPGSGVPVRGERPRGIASHREEPPRG